MKRKWNNKSVVKLLNDFGANSDPVEIIRSLGRDLVLNAFTKGWTGPPFDIIQLCRILGFEVIPNDLVIDARISPKTKDKFLIEYNPFQHATRINFSLAHEIGHSLFSDCAETIRYRNKELEENSWELEFLCNVAAAEILLPYAKFYKDANETPLTLDGLKSLSELYKASLESVFIRFCEVVNKPCMAMISQFTENNNLEMQYMVKSESCELEEIRENFTIPKDSKPYECIKPGWTSHDIESWIIFNKAKYRVYSIGLPPIRKQTQPRVGIFVVPIHLDVVETNSLYIIRGDATSPRGVGNKIIAQVVNTSAGVGFGFGRALGAKYPITKKKLNEWKLKKDVFILGNSQLIQVNDNIWVHQMIAQEGIFPKYGQIPLRYDSLRTCLQDLANEALALNASIHMPMIGAGQARGDWSIIQGMIYQELTRKNIEVTVYVLPGAKKEKDQHTLFNDINHE